MKRLIPFLLALLTCSCGPADSTTSAPPAPPAPPPLPANSLVQNGDFSQGAAHWEGDVQLPRKAGTGIDITLNPAAWTRIYQTFKPSTGTQFSIVVNYRFLPGLTVSQNAADYANITKQIQIPGFDNYPSIHLSPGQCYGTIGNPNSSSMSMELFNPNLTSTDLQTYTHTYPPVPVSDTDTFALAFPPGTGTVFITGIAVTSN